MAKRTYKIGSTGVNEKIVVTNSSTGDGLTGLTYNTSNLVAYYLRDTASAPVQITLVAGTLGSYTDSGAAGSGGGFVAVPNQAGGYQLSIPDAAFAAGAKSFTYWLQGAANMRLVSGEIDLVAVDFNDSVRFGLTALPNATQGAQNGLPVLDSNLRVGARAEVISNNAITNNVIADGALTTAKIADNALTAPKIATDAISAAKIANDAVQKVQNGLALDSTVAKELTLTGALATLSAAIAAISNNTSTRLTVAPIMEIPESGSVPFKVELLIMDSNSNMEAPDALPTITVKNANGIDRSANLSALSLEDVGSYSATYTLPSSATTEQLTFTANIVEGGATRIAKTPTSVVNADVTTMAATLNAIYATYAKEAKQDAAKTVIDGIASTGAKEAKQDSAKTVLDGIASSGAKEAKQDAAKTVIDSTKTALDGLSTTMGTNHTATQNAIGGVANGTVAALKNEADWKKLVLGASDAAVTYPSSYPGQGTITVKDESNVTIGTITLNYDANKNIVSRNVTVA